MHTPHLHTVTEETDVTVDLSQFSAVPEMHQQLGVALLMVALMVVTIAVCAAWWHKRVPTLLASLLVIVTFTGGVLLTQHLWKVADESRTSDLAYAAAVSSNLGTPGTLSVSQIKGLTRAAQSGRIDTLPEEITAVAGGVSVLVPGGTLTVGWTGVRDQATFTYTGVAQQSHELSIPTARTGSATGIPTATPEEIATALHLDAVPNENILADLVDMALTPDNEPGITANYDGTAQVTLINGGTLLATAQPDGSVILTTLATTP